MWRVLVMGSGMLVLAAPTAVQVVWLIVVLAGLAGLAVTLRVVTLPPSAAEGDLV